MYVSANVLLMNCNLYNLLLTDSRQPIRMDFHQRLIHLQSCCATVAETTAPVSGTIYSQAMQRACSSRS